MNVYEAIRLRKSVRAYKKDQVEREKIERIFDAVRLAPSARNAQEWRFIVVDDPSVKSRLAREAAGQSFLADCPIIVACCARTDARPMRCGERAYPIDIAIAVDHLTLAAVEEGLGTCWIGSFDAPQTRLILGIPEDVPVVALVALGYPRDPNPVEKDRDPLTEVLFRNSWDRS
jgi:nitroreductase